MPVFARLLVLHAGPCKQRSGAGSVGLCQEKVCEMGASKIVVVVELCVFVCGGGGGGRGVQIVMSYSHARAANRAHILAHATTLIMCCLFVCLFLSFNGWIFFGYCRLLYLSIDQP